MSKYIKIIFNILIVLACYGYVGRHNVLAADSSFVNSTIRVSPILLRIQLEPGSKRIYPITVDNLSNAPMPIHAVVEGFDPSDEVNGYTPNPPSEISPLARWMSIDEPDAIIPSRDSHEFLVKVNVPGTVALGGYYAIIYFTPLYPNGTIGSKIGVVSLANIGVQDSLTNKAHITDFHFEKLFYEHGPITSTVRITNDSLHFFSTKPTLTIAPILGKPDTVELDEKTILPGKARTWKSVFTIQNSKWGIYRATLRARLEHGEEISKTIPLVLLPYTLIGSILGGVIILLLLNSRKKNFRRALHAFMSENANSKPTISNLEPTIDIQTDGMHDSSRIHPSLILKTLASNGGSVSKTAQILGIHRATVHRWKSKSKQIGANTEQLARKSTRPIHVRTTTVPKDSIKRIVALHANSNMTSSQIRQKLHLTVSERTILRIIKKYSDSSLE